MTRWKATPLTVDAAENIDERYALDGDGTYAGLPDLHVEINPTGSAWVDITSDLRLGDGVTCFRAPTTSPGRRQER